MSKITVIGNATNDVELRYTQSGIPVGNVTVAENWKRGEQEGVNFHRVTIWREMAEHAAATIRKGLRVIVVGRLDQRDFETREGEKRSTWEITADAIGPDLRFATAAVTRTERGTNHAQTPAPAASAPGWDGNTWDSQSGPQAPAPAADQWAAQPIPGTDETPF